MAEKLFYSMGEVAEMFDVNTSLIRHWESQFSVLRPKRNKKGNRLFSPADIEKLKMIYHLVKECGMTLEGAKKALRKAPVSGVNRDTELMERLQRIRSLLVEVREDLKQSEETVVARETNPAVGLQERTDTVRRTAAVVRIDEEAGEKGSEESTPAARRTVRKPRRKKEEPEHKELFAFYEQSLF